MAIRTLDERHRKVAEELVKGTPRTKISELVEVTRQTINAWERDPVFIVYYQALVADVERARIERLTPMVESTAGLLKEQVDTWRAQLREAVASGDPDVIGATMKLMPSIESVAKVLEKLLDKQQAAGAGRTGAAPRKPGEVAQPPQDPTDHGVQSMLEDAFPNTAKLPDEPVQ